MATPKLDQLPENPNNLPWLRVDYFTNDPSRIEAAWMERGPFYSDERYLVHTENLAIYNASGLVIYIHKDLLNGSP